MAQRGGKDLRDLKGLPRNAVGSYIRKAVDKRRPSAPVASGAAAPILERFPALKLYNPKAWSDWMKSYVKNRLGPRHKFNYYEPLEAGSGVYPLRQSAGTHVRVALAGDWGTGTDEARRVAAAMAATDPHFTIHLGDIYYVGSLAEVNEHVLGIDNPHNDYTPCTWPLGSVGSFALNGNHEMYGLGDAYFELLLPQLGIWRPRQRQQASFFCLENEDWRVIALDTAYNAIGWPFLENLLNPRCHLEDQEIAWLRKAVRLGDRDDTRGVVLLSHHQYYSAFDTWYPAAAQQLAAFLKRPVIWFWGHEHRLSVYGLHAFKGGIEAHGRCIGHGGMPVDRWDPDEPLLHAECAPMFVDTRPFPNDEGLDVGYNGFAVLDFDGPALTVRYRDLTGHVVWTETWTLDRRDGSLALAVAR